MDTTRFNADRIGGLIWFVFGAAIVYGSWMMDRLEQLNIPPATAPGVVPGLLGLGIMAFALVLMLRRGRVATVDFAGYAAPPCQSVITPPAPRITGTSAAMSHGFMIGSMDKSAQPEASSR